MEGLVKGLLDVALGDGGHNRNNNNNNNNNGDEELNYQSRDERSRSSWAEVVSGDQEDNKNPEQGWKKNNNRKEVREDEDWPNVGNSNSRRPQKGGGDDNDDWQNVGERHSRRPQKDSYGELEHESSNCYEDKPNQWNRKEENEGNDGGWETVGKRPEKRPQKIWMDHSQGYKRPPTEQEYGNEVEYGSSIEPSEEELMDLSQACSKLWELDSNRLTPGKDYEIICGKGKKTYQKEDVAQGSLFDWLSEDVFKKPTYSRFCSLLDNYNPVVGSKEEVTSQERQEQAAFIEEISRTAPIKYLHKYLTLKGVVSESPQDFKRLMTELWFALCGRGGCASSSAFEHVFVGEIKTQGEDQVSGFHNWLQFYLEEAKGRVDYQGYIYPRRRGEIPDSETQLLTIQFEWNGVLKNLSSTLVGVSPEFEIALYTLCFFMGGEDNHVQIGPYSVNIRCYRLGNDKIGSAFPIAEA